MIRIHEHNESSDAPEPLAAGVEIGTSRPDAEMNPVPPAADAVDFAVFDIESAPLDDVTLAALWPPFEAPSHTGEFDPAAVKYGNTKDPAKRAEKLADEQAKHAAAVENYHATVAAAQAEHFAKLKDRAALDATTGRVVAIGVSLMLFDGGGSPSGGSPSIIDCDGEMEEYGLRAFWGWVAANIEMQRPMLGHNILSFDMPFLVRRSWLLGVPVPIGVRQGRNWNPLFIDTMVAWTFGRHGEYVGLDAIAKAFGLAGKVKDVAGDEIEGKTFYLAWRDAARRKTAEAYLMADLRIPAEVARKMGIV